MAEKSGLITLYSEVTTKIVNWLWFPYIAYGKLTLLQGDPGEGKSTMMLQLIAEISTGGKMPDGNRIREPQRVIYQCSEDGAGDTIKPRLIKMGADCNNIAFINEEVCGALTLDDERIREAMIEFEPKLLVIDPVQAYIGNDFDLQVAGKARRLMRRLGMWAEAYDCAIILVGHMNKRESAKGLYRGLGSIDVIAAARSVLQVERDPGNPNIRIVSQIKNSLESVGKDIRFEICPQTGFRWIDRSKPINASNQVTIDSSSVSKKEDAAHILIEILKDRDMASTELFEMLTRKNVAIKTARAVQKQLGIKAYRLDGRWYWSMKRHIKEP